MPLIPPSGNGFNHCVLELPKMYSALLVFIASNSLMLLRKIAGITINLLLLPFPILIVWQLSPMSLHLNSQILLLSIPKHSKIKKTALFLTPFLCLSICLIILTIFLISAVFIALSRSINISSHRFKITPLPISKFLLCARLRINDLI